METKREIESSDSNVEMAIAAGLAELRVERDAVQVEVLDEGSRGLLGIGARPARVRLTVETPLAPEVEGPPPPAFVPTSEPPPVAKADAAVRRAHDAITVEEPPAVPDKDKAALANEFQSIAPIACQTLEELLEKMGVHAQVEDYVRPPQDEEDYAKLILNVRGHDLGVLIGRRGETLNALQYLTRLIVGREVERRVNLVVDVEGYRVRRERSLQKLAQRMAERAVATGHRQVLEPMPPAERRIVHVALRHHPDIATESIGQGENRKVTIFLRGSK